MRLRTLTASLAAVIVTLAAGTAAAQHEHHHHMAQPAPTTTTTAAATAAPSQLEVGLTLTGARFDQALYAGDYAGVGVHVGAQRGRFGAHVGLTAYHLRKNGASRDGVGDLAFGVDAEIYQAGALSAGLGLGASVPTGDMMAGLGMGHAMLMPMAWATHAGDRGSLGVSAGWCGKLASGSAHHDHGAWPLVEPMTGSEVMASVHGETAVAGPVRAGAKLLVAVPLDAGANRLVATLAGRWVRARSELGAELQAGLAGDPFTVRALLTSALRF